MQKQFIGNQTKGITYLLEAFSLITNKLDQAAIGMYGDAITKVSEGEKLNPDDLLILDQIDQLTFEALGFCLKDAVATRARVKACKTYGINFNDRDGLIDHMNLIDINDIYRASDNEVTKAVSLPTSVLVNLDNDELEEMYLGRFGKKYLESDEIPISYDATNVAKNYS